jgi:Na+-translocating ferredoxin:NAD+ oxidoreductase RnfD subunit
MSGPNIRLAALRRFAITITVLNLLGHTVLGFENSWAQMVVALGTSYLTELLLEVVDASASRRPRRFEGGIVKFIDFLLPAHISGMAVSMLLFTGDLLLPFAFASAVAIASKALFTFPVNDSERHFLNPSNTGIAVTVFLFSTMAPIMPWQFTETLTDTMSGVFAAIVIALGTFMNWRYTRRMPLILAWVLVFALQGVVRCVINDLPLTVAVVPVTGVSFLLFTFYMVTDPGATPSNSREQVLFGASIAVVYCLLVLAHVAFGFFYALFIVSFLRGLILRLKAMRASVGETVTSMQGS